MVDLLESKDGLQELQDIVGQDLFSSDSVGSELDSVIAVLERHGVPLDMRQSRAIAYARSLCPASDVIRDLEVRLDASRFKATSPELFLRALDAYTLADRVTGRLPLSKAFNAGGEK